MIRYAILLMVCLGLTGCDSGGSQAPISGVITLDGQPLENASVTFTPPAVDGQVVTSNGLTDASGKYSLKVTSTDAEGAVLGTHTVTIVIVSDEIEGDDETDDSDENELPEHDFSFDVTSEGSTSANFDL
ncbi:MAG: hypothetical protein COA78_01130 [Blastopirellula sp.]|nr:MAG: hypothetical protein COA78_01130 [Blastopirellula sp.]